MVYVLLLLSSPVFSKVYVLELLFRLGLVQRNKEEMKNCLKPLLIGRLKHVSIQKQDKNVYELLKNYEKASLNTESFILKMCLDSL